MAPPYDPSWGELCPCSIQEYVQTANKAGYGISFQQSTFESSVWYVRRFVDGTPLTAVVSPDHLKDRVLTVRYICEKLGIPKDIFHVE